MTTTEANTQTIRLSSIVELDAFQIRRKLDPGTIQRYEQHYRNEAEMPPIKIALLNGAPILVDGWHRVAALRRAGVGTAEAIVREAKDVAEARWMAAEANLAHGLPLKASEVRDVFKAYIHARRHVDARGRLKSLRQIGKELGRAHHTIKKWMAKDFKALARRYNAEHLAHAQGGLPEAPKVNLVAAARQHLTSALAVSQGILDARSRAELIAMTQDVLKAMQEGGPWKPDDGLEDDF